MWWCIQNGVRESGVVCSLIAVVCTLPDGDNEGESNNKQLPSLQMNRASRDPRCACVTLNDSRGRGSWYGFDRTATTLVTSHIHSYITKCFVLQLLQEVQALGIATRDFTPVIPHQILRVLWILPIQQILQVRQECRIVKVLVIR